MDLVVIPLTRTLDVNPSSPNIATSAARQIITYRVRNSEVAQELHGLVDALDR